jgi:hypothetical protein
MLSGIERDGKPVLRFRLKIGTTVTIEADPAPSGEEF